MPSISLFVRQIHLSNQIKEILEQQITTETEAKPGQIRKKADWYFLTYLRMTKVKNFDPAQWGMTEVIVDCIHATAFRLHGSRLVVLGGKSCIKEIAAYFDALALNASKNDIVNDQYNIQDLEIDLEKILTSLENAERVEGIKKVRVRPLEVTIGTVNNCVVNTEDYGGARNVIVEDNSNVFGVEIALKSPSKTSVYIDLDGQIRVNTTSEDVDVESLALEFVDLC